MNEKKFAVWKDCLAVLIAIAACSTTVALVEAAGHQIYGAPEIKGKMFSQQWKEGLAEYIETAPIQALLFPVLAHGTGCLVGGFLVCVFRRQFWITGVLIVGILFTFAGIMVQFTIPHPTWMMILDLSVYIPCAVLGGLASSSLLTGAPKSN